jgi:hypothetical protein
MASKASGSRNCRQGCLSCWLAGNDKTFEDFPQRIAYSLSHTFVSRFRVEPIVYPQFKTQGSLADAVLSFLSWLQDFIAEKELAWLDAKNAQLEGKGKQRMTWSERDQARIVLMGHSFVSFSRAF